jgi:hypothetical protein
MIYGAENYRDPRRVAHYVSTRPDPAFIAIVSEAMRPPGAGGSASRYLVQQGFGADVLDGSAAMVEAGQAANADLGDKLRFICADINQWRSPPTYRLRALLRLHPRAAGAGGAAGGAPDAE